MRKGRDDLLNEIPALNSVRRAEAWKDNNLENLQGLTREALEIVEADFYAKLDALQAAEAAGPLL